MCDLPFLSEQVHQLYFGSRGLVGNTAYRGNFRRSRIKSHSLHRPSYIRRRFFSTHSSYLLSQRRSYIIFLFHFYFYAFLNFFICFFYTSFFLFSTSSYFTSSRIVKRNCSAGSRTSEFDVEEAVAWPTVHTLSRRRSETSSLSVNDPQTLRILTQFAEKK